MIPKVNVSFGGETIEFMEGKSMNSWNENSTVDMNKKPKQHEKVEILVKGGEVLEASWLKDVNKYVRGVNSWHIIGTGNYIKDSDVIGWRYVDNTDSADNKEEQSADSKRQEWQTYNNTEQSV